MKNSSPTTWITVASALATAGFLSAASFEQDVKFLSEHVETFVLSSEDKSAQVAVVPAYQGRVMTSSAAGSKGRSLGWINRELIASSEIVPHINAFGGEDRFWMGPEGGQFGLFFKKGDTFDLAHWQTPAPIDSEVYPVERKATDQVSFKKDFELTNYSGTKFSVNLQRDIKLLDRTEAGAQLKTEIPSEVSLVAYQSENIVRNTGDTAWNNESGLLSIWILGMFNPSDSTTIVLPFRKGPESELGPIVNDSYFGKVPSDRLKIGDGAIFFSGDGQYRTKIGLSPQRALPVAGSYDSKNQLLTIIQYNQPDTAKPYVNSMWELQDDPYAGDVINSYNDGPPEPGKKPLGPFYELETSSPPAALAPGATATHIHRTFHFQGKETELAPIAERVLGVSLESIKSAL